MHHLTSTKAFWGLLIFTIIITFITKSWIPVAAMVAAIVILVIFSIYYAGRYNYDNFKTDIIDKSELSEEHKDILELEYADGEKFKVPLDDDDEVIH